ncbi:MAG: hypothetical protein ANABAC_1764 [Anaerolineae bacterium]|nr:MAG: hypothetical protein ANABAC_1764 [Anaerolineae bacterium]
MLTLALSSRVKSETTFLPSRGKNLLFISIASLNNFLHG